MARLLLRDLTPGTAYKIQLRAVEGDSVSEWSRLFDLPTTSDTTAPDAPVWAAADFVVNGDTFVATWLPLDFNLDQNKDFSNYEIEFGDGSTTTVLRTNNTSYTLTYEQNRILFGSPKATVTARVRAVDAVGNTSAWTSLESATNPAPSPVDSITVTALYDSIDVKWADSVIEDDFNAFVLQVSTTSASSGFSTIYTGPDLNYTYATTMFGTDHWFRVYARDKFNSMSTAVTSGAVRPKSSFEVDTVAPDVPTALTAAITNNTNGIGARAALTWAQANPAENDLAGFNVRWRKVGDTNYSQTSFSHEDRAGIIELQAAYQNYEFQIRSFDWMGNYSAWTATTTATSPSNTAPSQVTGLAAVAGRDSIRYTWTPSTAADLKEYEVTFSTSPTFASGNITFKTGTAAALTVSGLTPATTYYARVRAIDTVGANGSFSATNTTATLAQLTPDDIGAPSDAEFNTAVKSYVNEYAVNSSETVAPTTGWSTTQPVRNPGEFIWFRTVVTKQDNSTSTGTAALLTGNTGATGSQGIPGPAGSDGTSLFTWLKYADTPTTGMSDDPTGKTYIGIAYNKSSATESTNYADYSWSLIKGADGSDGADGAQGPAGADGNGITGTTVTYQVGSSGTTAPTGTWLSTVPATSTGQFLWTRTVTTYNTGAPTTAYAVAAHGATGAQGNTGAAGRGISSTAVTYAKNTSGTAAPASGSFGASIPATTTGEYLWTRTIITYTDATTTTAYSVSAHGATGSQGVPGPAGSDGQTLYTWIKYATDATGTSMSDDPTGRPYIGFAYNKTTATESTTPGDYTWSLIQGAQGPQGVPGPAGADGTERYTWIKYADSPTTGMADSPVGKTYMGIAYNKTSATESANYADYEWSLIKGADGAAGADGKGISNTVVTYQTGSSGTTAPTGTWQSAPTATTTGQFLWTRTVITYTDASTATAYSVSAHGSTGSTGSAGRGITGTVVDYQKSTNGTTAPTGTWTASIPVTSPGEFLWTRTTTSYSSAPTSVVSYSVAAHGPQGPQGQQGIQGPAGADGQPTYTWIKYADSAAGAGMSDDPTGKIYIGLAYNKNTATESTTATDYSWSLIQGPQGPAGTDGTDGTNGTNGTNGVSVTAITRYWLRQTAGAGTPATPGNVATPGGSWTTTEPDYLAGTELWMMDRISYSNGTYAYTAPAKSSSYAAAVTAITAANGKNKIIFSTGDATGTSYAAGDLWYKRDANNVIIGTWEFTTSWQPRTYGDATLASLNVGKLVSGDITSALIKIASTGAIQSTDYAAGSLGWKLSATGLEINKGSVKASALIGDTLGSSTGTIDIAAGAAIRLNGGYIKSNTNTGTTFATAVTSGAGFYLGNDGLFIGSSGSVKAGALESDTLTAATITLGASGVIQGGSWSLSSSGLSIPDGGIAAQKIVLQAGPNIMPARQASWEGTPSSYSDGNGYKVTSGGVIGGINTSGGKFGPQKLGMIWGAQANPVTVYLANSATDYNIPVEAGKTYIFSLYAYSSYAQSNTLKVKWSNGTIVTLDTETLVGDDNPVNATRLFGNATAPAGVTGAVLIWENPNTNVAGGMSVDGVQVEEKVSASTSPSSWSAPGVTSIDGGMIKTGIITSTNKAKITRVTPIWDNLGNQIGFGNPTIIDDPDNRPAFNINSSGDAEFSNMLVRGNITVGVPSGAATGETTVDVPVTLLNVTNGSYTATAAPGTFKKSDVGAQLSGVTAYYNAGAHINSVSDDGSTITTVFYASASGTNVAAILPRAARYVSVLKSYNYVEGETGWILRSDGTAELRSLAYDSLDGGAIKANSLRAESLVAGSIEAALTLSGSFETLTTSYNIALNSTSGSATITRYDGTYWTDSDVGAAVVGNGIPPGTTIASLVANQPTQATMTSAATATQTNVSMTVSQGRKVAISPKGITLENAAGENVVTLPTDGNEAATFKGSIEANDLYVRDEFRMFGVNNSLGQASELHLNSGTYTAPAPKVSFTYDSHTMTEGSNFTAYDPSKDAFVNDPTGFAWDQNAKKYCFVAMFFGTAMTRAWGPGNTSFAPDGQRDWTVDLSNALHGGDSDYAYGGMKVIGDNFYFLTKNINTGVWRLQRITRTGIDKLNGPISSDRTLTNAWRSNDYASLNGNPAFDIYNGDAYIAKLTDDNKIAIYKYNGLDISAAPAFVTTKNTSAGSIASLNVGTFDMGATVYAVVTTQNGNSTTRFNNVYTVGTSSFGNTSFGFAVPGGYNNIGTAWIGADNNDSNGYFRTLGMGGSIYTYTQFAATKTLATIYTSSKWRNSTSDTYGPMSPIVATTSQRRAKLIVSAGSSIPNVGGSSPNAVAFYMSDSTANRYRLQLSPAGVTSQVVPDLPTSGTFTETAMAAGVPSKILAGTNLEISGDGYVRTNRLILQSTLDANNVGGNTPALMIGTTTGTHLRIDNNEIIAMTGDTTQGTLILNSGGNVNVTKFSSQVRTSTDIRTNVDGASSGGIFDENYATSGTTTAQVNTNGRFIKSASSRRLKEEIEPMSLDMAKTVLGVESVTYEWKDKEQFGPGRYPGVIAEQAHEVGATPWVAYENERDEDGNLVPSGFRYSEVTVAHNMLIKELYSEIESLKAEVAALRG